MIALVAGFLLFHIGEKGMLIHHGHEEEYAVHKHPQVGVLSALALSGHSFLDGVGIGLGFQVNAATRRRHRHRGHRARLLRRPQHRDADAYPRQYRPALAETTADPTPGTVLGALSTLLFHIPNHLVPVYLGFFAGFLLYIGASDILPEAHSKRSTLLSSLLTVVGAAFAFLVTRFAG